MKQGMRALLELVRDIRAVQNGLKTTLTGEFGRGTDLCLFHPSRAAYRGTRAGAEQHCMDMARNGVQQWAWWFLFHLSLTLMTLK